MIQSNIQNLIAASNFSNFHFTCANLFLFQEIPIFSPVLVIFCLPTLKISPTLLYLGRQDSVLIHYRDILIPLKIQIPAQEYYAKLFSFAPAETLVSMILTLSHPYIQDPFSGSLVYLERFVGVQVKRKLETGEKGTRTRNMADGTNAKGDIMM